jgi:hypothetical protein
MSGTTDEKDYARGLSDGASDATRGTRNDHAWNLCNSTPYGRGYRAGWTRQAAYDEERNSV